jgi:hypothetical protein
MKISAYHPATLRFVMLVKTNVTARFLLNTLFNRRLLLSVLKARRNR